MERPTTSDDGFNFKSIVKQLDGVVVAAVDSGQQNHISSAVAGTIDREIGTGSGGDDKEWAN